MKRLFALLGIFCVLFGLRGIDGDLTALGADGVQTLDGCQRLELALPDDEGYGLIKKLGLRECWREQVEGMTIVYAYSPNLTVFRRIKGKKINLMVALRGDSVVVGYPLLTGSY